MKINPAVIMWIILSIASAIWIGSDPNNGLLASIFWGGFLGFVATGTLIAAFGQIWIGWHSPEIIDEVVDGLLGKGRK